MKNDLAFRAFSVECAKRFSKLRAELTDEALARGQLSREENCVGLFVAGVEIAAGAVVGGNLPADAVKGQLELSIEHKRRKYAPLLRRHLQ